MNRPTARSSFFQTLTGSCAYAMLLLTLTLSAWPAPADGQTTGSITGTVTDAASGAPLSGVGIYVADSSGNYAGWATSNVSGVYSQTGLPPGTYYVRTYNSLGYIDELYDDHSCEPSDCYPYTAGTPVVVTAGTVTPNINFVLVLGGSITGTVTDAGTGQPLAGVDVAVMSAGSNMSYFVMTNASGVYTATGLATSTYEVWTSNSLGYLDEKYNDVPCNGSDCWSVKGNPVNVTIGAATGGINFGLVLGGTISGTVTDVTGALPVANVRVGVHNAAGIELRSGATDATGQYAVTGLPAGTHYVSTAASGNYLNEIYADIPCPSCSMTSGSSITIPTGATGVAVTLGATTPGIDFALSPGGSITGTVTDAATGLPLTYVGVEISNGAVSGWAQTDASGVYTIAGLYTGTYSVSTYSMSTSGAYVNEVYDNVPCRDMYCYGVVGTGVQVTAGAATTGIDFGLARGGSITGTVTSAVTHAPLQYVYIRIYRAGSKYESFMAYTDASGVFVAGGIPTGTYYVVTDASWEGYVDQLYGGQACPHVACTVTDGAPVSVTIGAATSGIDFALAPGASISGTITDAGTGLPIETEIEVAIYSSTGTLLGYTSTDGEGAYELGGLPSGTYYARTIFAGAHIKEIYDNLAGNYSTPATDGTPIAVTAPAATTGIDFQLVRGGAVSGTLVASGTGAPLVYSIVYAVMSDGHTVVSAIESDSTTYTLPGLPPGAYYIKTFNRDGYVDEVYDDVACVLCDVSSGQLVTVIGTDTTPGINFVLNPLPAAPNDACASAADVTSTPFTHTVSTAQATGSPDDAPQSCGAVSVTMSRSVWYRFTPPADGTATIRTEGSTYDTVISVYTGSCGGFTEVPGACYDDAEPMPYLGMPSDTGSLKVALAAGVTYSIQVASGDGGGGTLNFMLDFKATSPPASDFTGDRKSDILWRHATGGDLWLWPMDGAARTAESYVRTVGDTTWEIRGVGDFTGDGKADILWRNAVSGQIYLWPMDGPAPSDEIYVGTVDPAYDIVGTGDFDGDGKSDLLWRHVTLGDVWIWLMDGATPLSEAYIDRVDPGYLVKGVGDLDADAKADIVWHHAATGEVWVWPMNGTARLDQVWVGSVPDTGYQIQAVADFTGDAKADIVWWHATRGEVWIWTMNGPVREAETWVGTVPDTDYRIVGAGDYDGDGKADILWHHATRGEVWVWLMDGTTKLSETWMATVPEVAYQVVKR